MPTLSSRKIQPVQRPAGSNAPDKIVDPFTIPPLDGRHINPLLRVKVRGWRKNRFGEAFDTPAITRDIRIEHLIRNINQGVFRVGSPESLIGPDGQLAQRTKRPDDFALVEKGQPISPMEPAKPFEQSPFWHSNIGTTCFPPTATYQKSEQPDEPSVVACAIPNSFPFFDSQELIVFPNTKAVSISQLSTDEIDALGALLQDRYRAMVDAGYPYVWFGMHRGQDGGGTIEHLHFQVYGSNIPPRIHLNIWKNEQQLEMSNFEFQRLRGQLTISTDQDKNTEIYSPYTGGFPLGMGVSFTKQVPNVESERELIEYIHLDDMSEQDLRDWLSGLAKAVDTIEKLPLKNRANGLAGYSLSFVVPPKGSNLSPMTWNVNPAKLRSVPFEQFDALENPINPFNARDILASAMGIEALGR